MGRETNRQRRERQAATAREKAAAARAVQARADQRRRAKVILSSVVAAAVVIAVIAVVAINHTTKNSTTRPAANPAILSAVTGVTPAALDQIGQGTATSGVAKAINDPELKGADGKPQLLYIGAEFCPICAAERWSLISALSRFGTFSGIKQIRSAVTDENLATFTFYKSSYTSKYLDFAPVEYEDRNRAQLESITKAQQALWFKYTGQGSFPFLDFAGKYVQTSEGYDGSQLSGKTWAQIATALKDPSSSLAKSIFGEANRLTAMICKMTNGQPASVCSASGVSKITLPQPSA